MDLDLKLDDVHSAEFNKDIEKTMPDIFNNVNLLLELPSGKVLEWTFAFGESLQTIKKKLFEEEHIAENSKLYLEEKNPKTYMLDPLSLNDFPKIQELLKANQKVKIIVEGEVVKKD